MDFVLGISGCGLIGLFCTYQQESVETRAKSGLFFPPTDNHGVGD